jgi:hypothetical protein
MKTVKKKTRRVTLMTVARMIEPEIEGDYWYLFGVLSKNVPLHALLRFLKWLTGWSNIWVRDQLHRQRNGNHLVQQRQLGMAHAMFLIRNN